MTDCIRWLWQASAGHRSGILCRGLIGICQVCVSLFSIWVCKCLVDVATRHRGGDLRLFMFLLAGCLVSRLLLSAVDARTGSRMDVRLRNGLRRTLFGRLMQSCWTGRESLHTGDVMSRLTEDVSTVTDMLCRKIPSVMVMSAQLAGAYFFLAGLDARLAAVTLCIMPVALLLSKRYVRRMRRLSRQVRETDSRVQSHLQEQLQHRTLVRTLDYTPRSLGRLASLQQELQRLILLRADFSIFSRLMVQGGFSAGYATVFLWGICGLRDGVVTFGMMTAFLQLVSQIQGPMVELSRQIPAFIHVITSVERLSALSSLPLERTGEAVRLHGVPGVRVEGVDFAYPGGRRRVLAGFTHDFRPGSLTAVLGETGAGKSTLLRMILALLHPDAGRVTLYDGRQEVEASPLTRCNLSYVPQGNTLFSGTIRDNLLMGNPHATEEELREALHTAAADFVYALSEGLDTPCGEQGAGLSEGQAQRIAIARSLLRPGALLLLDEPTSSLDADTEKLLMQRLAARVERKTLILVTHREATAELCGERVWIGCH